MLILNSVMGMIAVNFISVMGMLAAHFISVMGMIAINFSSVMVMLAVPKLCHEYDCCSITLS